MNNYKSIKKRIIFQISSLIALSIVSMIFFVSYIVISNMEQQAEISLKIQADSVQNKIENRLNYLIQSTELLAKNELLINSLVDEEGKDKYLTPLVKNFSEDKNVVSLSVVDFDGKAIFKTLKKIPNYKDSVYLRRTLAMGETTKYLSVEKNRLIIISAINYYNTTQGALIAEFNPDMIMKKYKLNDNFRYIKLFIDDKEIYNDGFNKDEIYYSYKLPLGYTPLFKKLKVTLEMGVLESYYLSPIRDAIYKLSLLGLVLLVIAVFTSYILSISVTNPILKLYNRVKNPSDFSSEEPLGTNDELEELSDAFNERTKQLEHSEKIYSNLYNNSPDMYLSMDVGSSKVITCNKTLLDKLGYKKEEIINKEIFNLFDKNSLDEFHEVFKLFKAEGAVYNKELQLKCSDGRAICILFSASSVQDEDGNIVHSHATMRDITEKKEHEKQMKDNETILFQQSKMASMGEMIGNIAHQWRQPLSAIAMSSVNMRANVELDEELSKEEILNLTNTIELQCAYLSKTIDDFRNFFMPNKDKTLFNVKVTVDNAMKLVSASFATHNIDVIESIEDVEILAYENELTQAILNIIKNSKDVLVTTSDANRYIFITVYKKSNNLYIEITDNGGGVPKDVMDKIFEPYFTTKHKSQGTGIGLYMTETIIKKHLDGDILIENVEYEYKNEKYKGAKFTIIIPLQNTDSIEEI